MHSLYMAPSIIWHLDRYEKTSDTHISNNYSYLIFASAAAGPTNKVTLYQGIAKIVYKFCIVFWVATDVAGCTSNEDEDEQHQPRLLFIVSLSYSLSFSFCTQPFHCHFHHNGRGVCCRGG